MGTCSKTRKIFLELVFVAEHSTCLNSGGATSLRECSTSGYAGVSSFKLHDNMLSVENLLQAAQNLLIKALLNLRAACEILHDAVELG